MDVVRLILAVAAILAAGAVAVATGWVVGGLLWTVVATLGGPR